MPTEESINRGPEEGSASRPDERPRPAYGEYAPEGWTWTPPGQEASSAPAPNASESALASTRGTASRVPSSGRVPGVPHNLGASGSPGQQKSAGSALPPEQHYRAAPPQGGSARAAAPNRLGDRIITIVLLALGAFGALNSAASLYSMSSEFSRWGQVLGIDSFSAPAALTTIGTVGALVVFALYALNLVYSLQRMRARKLAFWVPLATAVIAGIVTFAFLMFGVYQVPELLQRLAEPDAMQTILDSLATTPTS